MIHEMPKVELHVHLQGATQPETLLKLAKRNNIKLPEDIRAWYQFKDFDHFIQIYDTICTCFATPDDLELATYDFLKNQAAQNIVYTEVTYTPTRRIPFEDQLNALNRARTQALADFGVKLGVVLDIPIEVDIETGEMIADWAISGMGRGIVAFGLGGGEGDYLKHKAAINRAHAAGLPTVPHAGETTGAETIWQALLDLKASRIGHGVRCLEDPALVDYLREHQIPLEVNPTSNVCLGVFESLESHAFPHLVEAGLCVTINSDDPPMFNTTLTDEYIAVAETFGYSFEQMRQFVHNAIDASFLPEEEKSALK